jgi:hypothetical protein
MKLSLLTFAALLFVKASALAIVDLGSAGHTPYDRFMSPVKQVLGSLDKEGASMEQVQKLMRIGRGFRYSYTDPYNPARPEVTAATRAGDCKAKSLWLCDQLGDASVRYVIGKAKRSAKISHAWVMWQHEGRWWILDCTNTSKPIPADRVSSNEYIPLYSYDRSGSYRHAGIQMFANTAAVANGKNSPVAAQTRR